jgi:hypothetical protein
MIITETQAVIDRSALMEVEPDYFVAEASELQFPPGRWPRIIDVKGGFGNGQMLMADSVAADGSRIYKQVLGCVRIRVFND